MSVSDPSFDDEYDRHELKSDSDSEIFFSDESSICPGCLGAFSGGTRDEVEPSISAARELGGGVLFSSERLFRLTNCSSSYFGP